MTTAPGAAAAARPTINPWLIAPLVALAAFMEVLDISIANVSLQHIAGDLSAGQDEFHLDSDLLSGDQRHHSAGFGLAVVGDGANPLLRHLHRRLFHQFAGLRPGADARPADLLPGHPGTDRRRPPAGAQAILADSFPPHQRGMAFALYGMAVVFAPAIGPTLGGWITDQVSWRWVFLLNVPVGIVLTVLVTVSAGRPAGLYRGPPWRSADRVADRLLRLSAAGHRPGLPPGRAGQGRRGGLVLLAGHLWMRSFRGWR